MITSKTSLARAPRPGANVVGRCVAVGIATLLFAALCIVWIYPFLWMVSASLKQPMEVFTKGVNLIPDRLMWANYPRAWVKAGFNGYFVNTVIVTAGTLVVVLVRCSLAGYVLGRYEFRGKRLILGVLIVTFLVPAGSTLIPIVDLSMRLGLLNNLLGVILALGAGGNVAAVLLYMGYFSRIPSSLPEAAIMDGAGFATIFGRIMLPMTGPVTATVSILTFMGAWNNFMVPLVFTLSRPKLRTLAVGMLAFQGMHETDWSGMAAAGTIALIPIVALFLVLQKYFIRGMAGAVKG